MQRCICREKLANGSQAYSNFVVVSSTVPFTKKGLAAYAYCDRTCQCGHRAKAVLSCLRLLETVLHHRYGPSFWDQVKYEVYYKGSDAVVVGCDFELIPMDADLAVKILSWDSLSSQ